MLGLAVLVLAAAPCSAQGLDLVVEAGWDGAFVEDAWAPLRVTLVLPPGAPRAKGRVVCEPLPLESVQGVAAPFELAPSRDAPATTVVSLAVPARGDLSFVVRVEDENGVELARGSPRDLPRRIDARDRLVLLVGRKAGLAALDQGASLSALAGAGANANRPGVVRVARLAPEEMPDRAWLLSGAQAVFLEEGPGMHELACDETRAAALRSYVESGGTLVVVGGRGTAFWAGSPLDALLPVDASGDGEALPNDAWVSRCELRSGIDAQYLTGRSDTAPGHPLAAERRLGRGKVDFLAFDPDNVAFRGDPLVTDLLLGRLIPDSRSRPPTIRPDFLTELTTRSLQERPSIRPAGLLGFTLSFLCALVILGPIAARRRKAPSRVLLGPALAAALASLVVLVAALARPPLEVCALSYAFAESRDDEALVVEDTALFSGRRTSVDLELADQAIFAQLEAPKLDLLDFRSPRRDLLLEPGAPARIPDLELGSKALVWFRSGVYRPLPARPRVSRSAGDEVSIEAGPAPLPAGFAFEEDQVAHTVSCVATPPIAAGQRVKVKLAPSFGELRLWDEQAPPLFERSDEDRTRTHLVRTLEALLDEIQLTAPARSTRFPRTWLALPWRFDPLLRARENGRPIERSFALSTLLVAAEEP